MLIIAQYGEIFIILACLFGFFMAWGVGANDVANAMGTSVGSKAITIKQAILIAVVFEFLGAWLAGGEVTNTIRKGIIDPELLQDDPQLLVYGMLAALLAENGLGGPERPLEGPRGFLTVTGDKPDFGQVTGDLGTRWEVLRNIHKPYPCGVVLFPVIDACLALKNEHGIQTDEIEAVTLYGHPLLRQRTDRPNVETGREAQVSAQHAVAVCFLTGKAGLEQFSDAAVADPEVLALRARVRMEDEAGRDFTGVRAVVSLKDGRSEEITITDAKGTDNGPLSDGEIEAKFRTLAAYGAPHCRDAEKLIDAVWSLDTSADAGAIMALARPAP